MKKQLMGAVALCLTLMMMFTGVFAEEGAAEKPAAAAETPAAAAVEVSEAMKAPEVTKVTEAPKAAAAPTANAGSEATQAPAVPESSEANQAPTATENSEATQAPVTTENSEATQAPVTTENSEATQAPVTTENSEATQAPAATENAEATQAPTPTVSTEATQAPAATEIPARIYEVTFMDFNGAVLESVTLSEGEILKAPQTNPTREGYEFIGWNLVMDDEKHTEEPYQLGVMGGEKLSINLKANYRKLKATPQPEQTAALPTETPVPEVLPTEAAPEALPTEAAPEVLPTDALPTEAAPEATLAPIAAEEAPLNSRSIEITASWETEQLTLGDHVTLTAVLHGYESVEHLQWQMSSDNVNWSDIEGANEASYSYQLNEENCTNYWRISVTVPDASL
ncbi:MAG: InlB B-repeat-containing protein [Clostridia bacterium]